MLRLTVEREKRGWSRAELSRRARMSASDVGKIEACKSVAYPGQLAKLARALGVPLKRASDLVAPVEAAVS